MPSNVNNSDSKAQSILHFATWLQHALGKPLQEISALTAHLEALKSSQPAEATEDDRQQLHAVGVRLWNDCRRVSLEDSDGNKTVLAQVKAFAYLILARPSEDTAIRTARACIDTGQHALALSILERVSDSSNHEYALLRILLAWKQGTSSIADFFFAKVAKLEGDKTHEDAIGLFYDIGVDFLGKAQHEEALKWLGRAYNLLQKYDWRSKFDGAELRFNVQHGYCRSLFTLGGQEEPARQMLQTLKSEYPSKLPVLLLSMEHYADAKELHSTLEKTMHTMHLMETNFKLVIHYLHVIRKLNVKYACDALQTFIVTRLMPEKREDWIETSTMTLIWMITSDQGPHGTPARLNLTLESLRGSCGTHGFSSAVAQGAIVLIWKRIETVFQMNPEVAAEWCKTALLLANETSLQGGQYEAKLKRKLAQCYLAFGNCVSAQEVLESLPQDTKLDNLTRYLTYKIAIKSNNEEWAERALSNLASAPKDADKLLFACVSDVESHGNIRLQAKLLQRILDKCGNEPHPDVNISTLLRATARLLWQVVEDANGNVDEEILDRLCAVFKTAKNYSLRYNGENTVASQGFSTSECEWFVKNGYNLVMQKAQQWPVSYNIRLLEIISNFTYPKDIEESINKARQLRQTRIAYARVILYMTEVRNGDTTTYTKIMTLYNHSVVMGKSVEGFTGLLPFIFEATLHCNLEDCQTSLNRLLDSLPSDSPKVYGACADLVLKSTIASHGNRLLIQTAVQLLSRIISQVRTLPGYDIIQASRWIRCLVQLIIDSSGASLVRDNDDNTVSILKAILEEASRTAQDERSYPQEELDWLATSVFNLAVDFYVAERDQPAKELALLALRLAEIMTDQRLAGVLKERLERLGWSG